MEAKNVSQLVKKLNDDSIQKERFLNDPIQFLENVEEAKPINDKWVFLTIVGIVGTVLLTSIILGGIIIFRAENEQEARVPEFLISIGSTALGALVGLLSPSPAVD